MKNKPFRNALVFVLIFILGWIFIAFFKGWNWNHPIMIIFVPVWTIMLMWVVKRTSKKFYIQKKLYLPDDLETSSPIFKKRQQYWKQYKWEKIKHYVHIFAWMNVVMSVIQIAEFYDGESGIFLIYYYGGAATFAFLGLQLYQKHMHITDN